MSPADWDGIELIVFDVDGTLYNQSILRAHMMRDLLLHVLLKGHLKVIPVLRKYRRLRERLGDQEAPYLESAVIAETATTVGCPPEEVQAIVSEWIGQRPLRHLAGCRYPALPELLDGIRGKGKMIGVLSDYPAGDKLHALALAADHLVSACDDGVGFLKPHTRGLETLMAAAGVTAEATIMIGDRAERDGLVARRMGVRALIRSSRPLDGWQTFRRYDEALFAPLLASPPR